MKKLLIVLAFLSLIPSFVFAQSNVQQGGTGTSSMPTGQIPFGVINNLRMSSDSNLYWDNTNKRLGIGTTSPYSRLSVVGEVVASNFTATSTTATSTFPRLSVTNSVSILGEYFTNFTTYVRSLFSGTSPISVTAGVVSIQNAAADGTTKGAASFTAADFNSSSGNISIDYANGQEATSGQDGFLSSTDWTTFNSKVSGTGSAGTITIWNGTNSVTADSDLTYDSTSNVLQMGPAGGQISLDGTNGNVTFQGEIQPDGATCSDGQIIKKVAAGQWGCANDSTGGGGGDFPFTPGSYAGQTINSTSTGIRFLGSPLSIIASSSIMDRATTTNATSTNLAVLGNTYLQQITSALALTGSDGLVIEYAGTSCTNQFVRSLSATGVATCATVQNADLANSTISGVSLGNNLNSLSNGTTLLGSSYNGSATVSDWDIDLSNPNNWTGLQQFTRASSTQLSAGTLYVGATATTTIGSSGNVTLPAAGTLTVPALTSALVLTDANGLFTEYAGSAPCTNQVALSLSALGVITCTTVSNAMLANSTISGVALGNNLADLTAGNTSLTFSGSYNGSTARNIVLNTANANTWTALQQFSRASSTLASVYNALYVGTTATTTISGTATSTFGAGIQTSYISQTGTAATSTFANGINMTGGCYSINGVCIGSGSGSGTVNTGTTNQMAYYTGSTAVSSSGFVTNNNAAERLGIGTTTPWALLSVSTTSPNQIGFHHEGTTNPAWFMGTQGTSFFIGTSTQLGATSTKSIITMQPSVGTTSTMVGIGTSSPWRALSVSGGMAIQGLSVSTAGNAICQLSNHEIVTSGLTTCAVSSSRFKHDIGNKVGGLSTIMKMIPRSFVRNEPSPSKPSGEELGFIAEEVVKVEPRLVEYEVDGVTPRGVDYAAYTANLTKAIQEQQAQIEMLRTEIELLKKVKTD